MFHVSLATVQYWLARAGQERLGRVDWQDRPPVPHKVTRTPARIEQLVLATRRRLKRHSPLGEHGAAAIRRELEAKGLHPLPAVRTIGRILERGGALDERRRRHPAPPPGWYLPEVAQGRAELDSGDFVEDLAIAGVCSVTVFNLISLHGGLAQSWPARQMNAQNVGECLVAHWRTHGLPGYVQFDNDMRFQGPHSRAGVLSRTVRLCLALGVVAVFAPPRETGFQAAIENFNGRWQKAVWQRYRYRRLREVEERSARFIEALRRRSAPRIESAPARRAFPQDWELNLKARPRGKLIFLRRTDQKGWVSLLGYDFEVSPHWIHRLVRAEVELGETEGQIRFYRLRRRGPDQQPLLKTVPFSVEQKIFLE
jgi:hypothetical protein